MYTFEGDQAGYKTGHPTRNNLKMWIKIICIYFCVGINCLRTSTNDGALAALKHLIGLLCDFYSLISKRCDVFSIDFKVTEPPKVNSALKKAI